MTLRELIIYGTNTLVATSLMVLYFSFFRIFSAENVRKARFFLMVSFGFLFNACYLILTMIEAQSRHDIHTKTHSMLILSMSTLSSMFFILAARKMPNRIFRWPSTKVIIGVFLAFSLIAPPVELLVSDQARASGAISSALSALSLIALGFTWQTYFQRTVRVFYGWTKYLLVFSLYIYGLLQLGYLLPDSRIFGLLTVQLCFFGLGTLLKVAHISGLIRFSDMTLEGLRNSRLAYEEMKQAVDNVRQEMDESRMKGISFDELNHELATPTAELALRLDELTSQGAALTPEALKTVKSLVEQIQSMLIAFGRYRMFESDPELGGLDDRHSLNTLCDTAVVSIKYTLNLRFKVEPHYESGLFVYGREGEFYRIFRNVIKNAAEAMANVDKSSKRIAIRTGKVLDAPSELAYGEVLVVDNGPGIAPDLRERVFEDGYTTKMPSQGRGHGLAMARQLVERYNGTINVVDTDQSLGSGAMFRIRLPLCADEANSE